MNPFGKGSRKSFEAFWRRTSTGVSMESTFGKTIREAITLEFGSGALRVLGESQAWFRERVRRFLKEGGDPAF